MKRRTVQFVRVALLGAAAAVALVGCQSRSGQAGGEVRVEVTDRGFVPAELTVPAGRAVTLVMTRKTDQTCATEVVFPSLNQRYALPLNQPVRISLPAAPPGTLSYECGMKMLGGKIVMR